MSEPFKDEDTLRHLYIDRDLTQSEIGDIFGVHCNTIAYWTRKFDLSKGREHYAMDPPTSEKELRKLYWEDGLTVAEIGAKFGVSSTPVKRWMDDFGIDRVGRLERLPDPEPPAPKEDLYEMYVERGLGTRPISEEIGCTRNTVSRWIDRFGFEHHPSGGRVRDKVSDSELLELYIKDGLTQEEVARELDVDVHQSTVSSWLRDLRVTTRNQAGWGQKIETDRGETVKSSLECQIADWLYERGIEYEYEPDIEGTDYVPDFRVQDVLIEGWGIRHLPRYEKRRGDKIAVYEDLGLEVISVYHELDDRPGVSEVLPDVACRLSSITTKN